MKHKFYYVKIVLVLAAIIFWGAASAQTSQTFDYLPADSISPPAFPVKIGKSVPTSVQWTYNQTQDAMNVIGVSFQSVVAPDFCQINQTFSSQIQIDGVTAADGPMLIPTATCTVGKQSTFPFSKTGLSGIRITPGSTITYLIYATGSGVGKLYDLKVTLTLDIAQTLPQISPVPSTYTNKTSETFTVSGADYYKYTLDDPAVDNGLETLVSDPIILNNLSEGEHKLYLVGRNKTDVNWTPASQNPYIWTVDITPPQVTGLSNDLTPTSSKTWAWDSTESTSTYRYTIDQIADTTPSTSYSNIKTAVQNNTNLATDQTFYIHVQAKDAAGNESAVSHASAILKDGVSPVVTIARLPDQDTNAGEYTLTVSAADEGTPNPTIEYTYDSSPDPIWNPYTGSVKAINPGTYTFNARAADAAGNIGTAKTSFTIIAKPEVTGLSNDATPAKSKTWTWDSTDATSEYRYAIDNIPDTLPSGAYSNIKTAMQNNANLVKNTTFYIHVQAKSAAGYESIVVHASAILMDGVSPVVTIVRLPDKDVNDGEYTITVSAADEGTPNPPIEYSYDSSSWKTYTEAVKVSLPGLYTFYARAVDGAGNTGTANISFAIPIVGDINWDKKVDLEDAIIALKIMTNITVDAPNAAKAALNGKMKISHEDVLYILQKVSGIRK